MNYLTVDFGSTYTKLVAIDCARAEILGTSAAFTTIDTDVMIGFNNALNQLQEKIGDFDYQKLLCCSSAAGGLKMISVGLVPELTVKAAKLAASSAGAKVVKTYSFEISQEEQSEIFEINPDLVLLSGGTDGGNKDVIIANAKHLCNINRNFSIIVAGNKSASYQLEDILSKSGKDYHITNNVMPTFNCLNIEPAKKAIRDLFIRKIIHAKGLSKAQELAANEIIPTPLAVMNACELLSKGTKTQKGLGELMAVDIGGATTDVYSMATGIPKRENIVTKGLPEPFSKRTVEGDLGMRYSLSALIDEIDLDAITEEKSMEKEALEYWISKCILNPDSIPDPNTGEQIIEEVIARKAIEIAVERHCGLMERTYTPLGEIYSINGKDLTEIPILIGIGGALVNSINPSYILNGALYSKNKFEYMKPKKPELMLDEKYIFSSMGLLSAFEPEQALSLMKKSLKKI